MVDYEQKPLKIIRPCQKTYWKFLIRFRYFIEPADRRMIIILRKFIVVVFLLGYCAFAAGCATMVWNEGFDKGILKNHYNKNIYCMPEASRFCHPVIEQGYFKGITKRYGRQYYQYVVPDVFTEAANDDGLEITIPVSPHDKHAGIKTVDAFEKNDKVAYVIFYDRNIYKDNSPSKEHIPDWECSAVNPFKTVADEALAVDYPTLILVAIPGLSSGAQIRAGKRMNVADPSTIDAGLKKTMCVNCAKTGFSLAASVQPGVSNDDSCQWWYWSDIYETNGYKPMSAAGYNFVRVLGHLVTVPFDVVTSPVQLTAYIMLGPEYRQKISGQ